MKPTILILAALLLASCQTIKQETYRGDAVNVKIKRK